MSRDAQYLSWEMTMRAFVSTILVCAGTPAQGVERVSTALSEFGLSLWPSTPNVEVACLRAGAPSPCAVGAQLVFKVTGLTGFLTAFAQREGQTNWYFVALSLPNTTTPHALEEAVVISPEHGVGAFEIIFLQSAKPVDQVRARELLAQPEKDPNVRVLRRRVEVSP